MRIIVQLDHHVATAIERLGREADLGLSEAIHHLIRLGLQQLEPRRPFVQGTARMSLKVDVAHVAETLALVEDPTARRRASARRPGEPRA